MYTKPRWLAAVATRKVIRRMADFRTSEKSDPLYYARLTVKKAQAEMGRESLHLVCASLNKLTSGAAR